MFCQLNLISKKGSNAKLHKKAKNYQTLKIFSSLVSLTRHFTKFIFLEQPLCHSPICKICFFFFFFFFFFFKAVIMIRTRLFICIIFVKNIIIYWLILTVNHQGSYFPFFVFIQWVKYFCTPANFVTI